MLVLCRPEHGTLAGTSNEILVAKCLVRKGRILQKWIKRQCVLYNGTIRIEHGMGVFRNLL